MSEKNSWIIEYAGESFTLSGEDSVEHLQHVGELANDKLKEVQNAFGKDQPPKTRLLALSAINTAEVAVKLAEYSHSLQDEQAQMLKEKELLLAKIDQMEGEILDLECQLAKYQANKEQSEEA